MAGVRSEWLGSGRVRVALAVTLVAAGLVPVLSRQAQWLGSWKLALDWGTSSLILLGPVAAGIACGVYVRLRRAGIADLLGQSARPWRGWTAPALAVWVLGSGAMVALCLSATTAAWLAGATAYPRLGWVILPALSVLGAQVAIGALIGSLTGHYWAVPWAAVGTFFLFLLTKLGVIPVVFDTGAATGTLVGETFSPHWFVVQGVLALGITATVLALSHWTLFRTSSVLWKATTGAMAAAAAFTLIAVEPPPDRYEPTASVDYACRDGRPVVCLTEDAKRPLDDLAAKMQRLAGSLVAAGAPLPDRFVRYPPGVEPDPGAGAVRLFVEEQLASEVGYDAAAESLVTPAVCTAYSSDEAGVLPEEYFAVSSILVRWILVQDGHESAPSADDAQAGWWAQPTEEQYPWVRTTYDALRDCRLDDLRPPR